MKNRIFLIVILIVTLSGCIKRQSSVFTVKSKLFLQNLSYFDLAINENASDTSDWKIFIYLNAGANLSCFEDMNAWRKLESNAKQFNGKVSIWTNKNDSADVYWALKLEKINIPFNIMDSTMLRNLGLVGLPTHFKRLLNKQNKIYKTEAQIDDDLSYDVEIKDFLKRIMFYNR